ncbi:MAG: hypothetical protein HDR09_13730 [Lachnospiraceae bacterium]|nr:hypothetical protein [Lachnospiraceae bacterium]
MSYYSVEIEGQSKLRDGFKTKQRDLHTSDAAMQPCFEFESQDVCNLFNENLLIGLERIYAKYKNTSPISGQSVYWITTSKRTHLKTLVGQKEDTCKNPTSYGHTYVFVHEIDRDRAMREMQAYLDNLYSAFKIIDD